MFATEESIRFEYKLSDGELELREIRGLDKLSWFSMLKPIDAWCGDV